MGYAVKFQNVGALEQYIETGGGVKSYLILHSERDERRKLLEKTAEKIAGFSKAEISFSEEREWDFVYHSLSAPSLFGTGEVVVWDGCKNISEKNFDRILKYIQNPSPWAVLLIGAESFKVFSSLYAKAAKELAVLDLGEEKPWEKEKRQQLELLKIVRKEGKNITPGALARLRSLSRDSVMLESELAKVLCYVGDAASVTEKDVDAVTTSSSSIGWQAAEQLLWEKGTAYETSDLSAVLGLVGQVRFLLTQARQVRWMQREGKSEEEIMKHLSLRPAALQKILLRIKTCKAEYFESAMNALYDVEIFGKNANLDPEFLLGYLRIKLSELRKNYVG